MYIGWIKWLIAIWGVKSHHTKLFISPDCSTISDPRTGNTEYQQNIQEMFVSATSTGTTILTRSCIEVYGFSKRMCSFKWSSPKTELVDTGLPLFCKLFVIFTAQLMAAVRTRFDKGRYWKWTAASVANRSEFLIPSHACCRGSRIVKPIDEMILYHWFVRFLFDGHECIRHAEQLFILHFRIDQ
jgi:hypothetical protein